MNQFSDCHQSLVPVFLSNLLFDLAASKGMTLRPILLINTILLILFSVSYPMSAAAWPVMFPQKLSSVIVDELAMAPATKIDLQVVISKRSVKHTLRSLSPSPAFSVYSVAIDAVSRCDSMLRMIVDDSRLNKVKGGDYVLISFEPPYRLNIAYGGGKTLLVRRVLIPLSEGQTSPQWTMYTLGFTGDWAALRWTTPDPAVLRTLRQSSQRLLDSRQ